MNKQKIEKATVIHYNFNLKPELAERFVPILNKEMKTCKGKNDP